MKQLLFIALLVLASAGAAAQQRQIITTETAPKAIGPYSQAVIAGNLVFVSGQLGVVPDSGTFVPGGITGQTRQAIENLRAVLEAAGCGLEQVVACTVYMKDLNDFSAMNTVYAEFFHSEPPSRATVQVARLPKDGLVEISCIAVKP
jgi:2-iminobutanoate/2-iminopropanoate deaminase